MERYKSKCPLFSSLPPFSRTIIVRVRKGPTVDCIVGSLAFNGTIYITNKHQRNTEANCTEHQEESVGHASIVTNKEQQLHETIHIGLQIEVNGVAKNENSGGSPA